MAALPNFDFTQVEGTQGGPILNKADEENEVEGEEARQQANKDERGNDDGSEGSGEKENQMNEEPAVKKVSSTPRYISMDMEDIQSSQKLSQQAAEEAPAMSFEEVEGANEAKEGSVHNGSYAVPASASKPIANNVHHRSEAHSAEETISMSASGPGAPSPSIPTSHTGKDSAPTGAQVSSSSSHSSGSAINGNKAKTTPPLFSFDSGVAEAGTFSSISHVDGGLQLSQSQSDRALVTKLAPFQGKASTKNESIHASETSTVLDTSKDETRNVVNNDEEEEDSQQDGWINATESVSSTRRGTRKLEEFHKDLTKEREEKLRRQNTPPVVNSEDRSDYPQVSRTLVEHHDQTALYKGEEEAIKKACKELAELDAQLPSLIIPQLAAQVKASRDELEASIKEKQAHLTRFELVSWIMCDQSQQWYTISEPIVCDMDTFATAKWSYVESGAGGKKEQRKEEVEAEEEDDEEEDDDEILEEPKPHKTTDSEALVASLVQGKGHASAPAQEPTSSQVLASDALLNIRNDSGRKGNKCAGAGADENQGYDDSDAGSDAAEEEAELEFSQSQQGVGSANRLSRLRKTGSGEKKAGKGQAGRAKASPAASVSSRGSPTSKPSRAMKSVTMDVRDDEEEEEEDDEAGESAVQCDEYGIPLDLLATIRDQRASLDDLQGADWRKTIKDSLVAAGWKYRNSVGMEDGWRMLRPHVTRKTLQHYEHFIMDDEAPMYVGVAACPQRKQHQQQQTHKARFLSFLSEQQEAPRIRGRRSTLPSAAIHSETASSTKTRPSPGSDSRKRGRGKERGGETLRGSSSSSSSSSGGGAGGKRLKSSNRRYSDYLDPDTQMLEGLDRFSPGADRRRGRTVKYADDSDNEDEHEHEQRFAAEGMRYMGPTSAPDADETMEMEATQAQGPGQGGPRGRERSLTPQQIAAERKAERVSVEAELEVVDQENPPQLFAGRRFCFSGLAVETSERLKVVIEKRGGTLIGSVEDLRKVVRRLAEADAAEKEKGEGEGAEQGQEAQGDRRVVLLSCPGMYKREKFLIGLASPRHVVVLHPAWLEKSARRVSPVPVEPYLLPSGLVVSRPFSTLPLPAAALVTTADGNKGIFDGVRVADLTTSASSKQTQWGTLSRLAGATLLDSAQALRLLAEAASESGGGGESGFLAVVDPEESKWPREVLDWRDAMLKRHLDKEGATAALYGPWAPGERGDTAAVSVEWVTQSLAAGVKLRLNECPLFSLFQRASDSYFVSTNGGVPVRFTLGDMVQYNTEQRRCLGKIASFSHDGRVCKLLHIREEEEEDRGRIDGNDGHSRSGRPVTLDPEGRSTLVSTDKLLRKAMVLPEQAHSLLEYTAEEELIYCASRDWERAEEEREAAFTQRYFPQAPEKADSMDLEDEGYDFCATQGDW